uniref:FERM domain-containing protein 4A n=1 Tax=Cacopsylla melanoneura TaxID=428564 RepID=A0A8D8YZ87_9HEMI
MDCVEPTKTMVVSPRARRRVLEVKLKEKNSELRELCVREAELIGVLPPETPIEPGESPPSFTPKNTLFMKAMGGMPSDHNSSKQSTSKDEDSLASLEQECKIQSGIAEAAFGLANDVSISKSLRRKHRLMYQHSQNRISELEQRINLLKRTSNLDLKKNKNVMGYHQPHDLRDDRIGVPVSHHPMEEVDQPLSLALDNASLHHYQRNFAPPVPKHQIQWGGHYNHPDSIHPISQQTSHGNHSRMSYNKHINYNLPTMYSSNPHHPQNVYNKVSPSNIPMSSITPPNVYHHSQHPPPPSHNFYDFQPHGDLKRFGSLDRRRANYNPVPPPRPPHKEALEDPTTLKLNNVLSHKPQLEPETVLLPNQMYPENNIMRTQSLINVRESHPLPPRPWYEVPEPPLAPPGDPSPPLPPPLATSPLVSSISNLNVVDNMSYQQQQQQNQVSPVDSGSYQSQVPSLIPVDNTPYQSPTQVSSSVSPMTVSTTQDPDVVVPYESPKNQTVIQVGKFQPYREISKPFEMSDFYKYSTKFRRKPGDPGTNTNPKSNNNNNNNHKNTVMNKTKDNFMEQTVVTNYSQISPVLQQPPDSTDSDMNWIQNENKPAASSHASTFV